jgi:parallel beta-helix repeat protein
MRSVGMRLLGLGHVLVLAAVAAFVNVDAAHAADVVCGSEISTNTVLHHNLTCGPDGFLLLDAGVTFDLAGHTLGGSGAGLGIQGQDGSTILNGTVRDFGLGISASGSILKNLTIKDNGAGVLSAQGAGCFTLLDDVVTGNGDGVEADGCGLAARLTNSRISHNQGFGVGIIGQTDLSLVQGNTVDHNGGDGIYVDDSTTTFINNVSTHNGGDGIHVFEDFPPPIAEGYFFADNDTEHNGNYGIEVFLVFTDQSVSNGGGNIARHNGNPSQCLNIACITKDGAVAGMYRGNPMPHPMIHAHP